MLVTTLAFSLVSAALGASYEFSTDMTSKPHHFEGWFHSMVGSGHAALTLRTDWQSHMMETSLYTGVNRVRFHGILDDDMSVYTNGKLGMFNVFAAYDALAGVQPYVELSFMPEELASGNETVFHYKGNITPPSDWGKWSAFIYDFVSALVEKYGIKKVRTWEFEIWNEPNCGFYYEGKCCGETCGNKTAYFELYRHTALAVKKVDSQLRVGGPATAQCQWISEFLEFVEKNQLPCDFVSSHLYPTDPAVPHTRTGWESVVKSAAEQAASHKKPFFLSEFNAGLSIPDAADNSYSAAFLAHVALSMQDIVDKAPIMSFWAVSDIFEEGGFDSQPFHNGFGMININSVKKPVWRTMELLANLGSSALPVTTSGQSAGSGTPQRNVAGEVVGVSVDTLDVTAFANVDVIDEVTIMIVNFNPSSLPAPPTSTVTVKIMRDNDDNPTEVSLSTIDDNHVNPLAEWRKMGSPMYPTSAQIAQMQKAAEVVPTKLVSASCGANCTEVTVTVAPQSINLAFLSFV